MSAYTLGEVHEEIRETYVWWHRQAPGVTPRETGRLGELWAIADQLEDRARETGV